MIATIRQFARDVFDPQPHPIAGEAERMAQRVIESSDAVVAASEKLARSDPFAKMVRGMRGESPTRSKRARKR